MTLTDFLMFLEGYWLESCINGNWGKNYVAKIRFDRYY